MQTAGVSRKEALGIGICVDHRRRNKSNESLALNVSRLKAYKARLVVFPTKKGVEWNDDMRSATQNDDADVLAIGEKAPKIVTRKVTSEEASFSAYKKLRTERMNARMMGPRKKKVDDEASKEKK